MKRMLQAKMAGAQRTKRVCLYKFSSGLLAVVLLASLLVGCGGAGKTANASPETMQMAASDAGKGDGNYGDAKGETEIGAGAVKGKFNGKSGGASEKDQASYTVADNVQTTSKAAEGSEEPASQEADKSLSNFGGTDGGVTNAILAERKIIRSANVTIEVESFDQAYGEINNRLLGIGFIQETNITTDRVHADGKQKLIKHGTIVLRVDRVKFDKVLNGLKEIGEVYQWAINGEDVTEKYFDVDSRLKLLELEEERLLEYLKKLDDPDKIFKAESRLTDIRHEIESLTGTLRKLGDLVDLSTITLNMNEKYPGENQLPKPKTYGDRLVDKFFVSMNGALNFCGELIIIVISALPIMVLLSLFVLLVLVIYRKLVKMSPVGAKIGIKRAENKDEEKDTGDDTQV